LLALGTAATWAGFSVAIVPILRHYTPLRVGAVTFLIATFPLAATGRDEIRTQDFTELSWLVWLALIYSGVSLVVANGLWFRAVHRVGPARATLFANLQPFLAALIAVVLLSEPLTAAQVLGGIIIALGILVARRTTTAGPIE
jgi:drug/metabolite transporter (DMT)-like permease